MKIVPILPTALRAGLFLAASSCSILAAPIPGLINTGVSTNGALLPTGATNTGWILIQSADPSTPGPNVIVVNDQLFPIVAGPWLASGPNSKWVGPKADQSTGSPAGDYTYRLAFDLTGLEPGTAVLTLRISSDNATADVRLNGVTTGLTYDGNFGALSGPLIINSGFIDGINTLDFVVNNGGTTVNPTAFRAELSGTADPVLPPGTPPFITAQPTGQTNGVSESVSFTVGALGSRPLSYQWRLGGSPIANATNATLTLNALRPADAGAYEAVVSNSAGSITSNPAMLGVVFFSPAQRSYEPIGPSSRRTGLAISEIMFHPRDRADSLNLEFIEIYNSNPHAEDLSGYRLSGDADYTFPPNTSIPGQGYIVVAARPQHVQTAYGLTGVYGPLTNVASGVTGGSNVLPNDNGTVRLRKGSGGLVLEVDYSDEPPWPVAADGAGHSMILARPSYGERNARAWAASAFLGGSPGAPDPVPTGPLESIVINEILAHTDEPAKDYIELHNSSSLPVDISGCYLTDERNTNHFRITGVTLQPGQSVAYNQDQLGFALSSSGETVYFVNPAQNRVIDALRFGGQANGVAYGRFPDGAPGFQELATQTPGATNASPLVRAVVINEIMFNPISGDEDDEFVELYNRSGSPVNLGGWRFIDGIDFEFAPNTILPAGGYLVVAANTARMQTNYPSLPASRLVGNFNGNLSDGGERLALGMPDYGFSTNGGVITTNVFYIVVEEVTYVDGGRWGKWSDGGGSSLELIDPRSDNRLPSNWADSNESAKSTWTTIEHTGVMDLGHPSVGTVDQLHLFLLERGEALVDDVELIYNGINRITNSTFEVGTNGWFFHGTHRPSSLENEGYNSSRSLHVVATDRGDVVNRVRAQLSLSPPLNSTITLRAKARWLRGHPELLLRVVGNSLEAVGTMPVPKNLGTPGAPNSRAIANAGPAITEVSHRPVLPKAGQNIRVFARVQDADGLNSLSLIYRVDPSSTTASVPMADNGLNGDLLAGDGIFTGVIPGQGNAALVAFHIQANDAFNPPALSRFPSEAPVRECLVRVGETLPPGGFATYRFWMTQATFDFWSAREKSSNEDLDTTFVYGDTRVVYNVGGHYGSSENYSTILTTPTGTLVGYNLTFPDDDMLLGASGVRLDWPNRDTTMLREVTMFWLLDQYALPNHYRRFIHLYINGIRRGTIYNDTQRPNADSVEEWYSDDSEGELFKLNPWYEADAAGNINAGAFVAPVLTNRTTTGGATKTAYYRFAWRPRAVHGSANNYANLFAMIGAASAPASGYSSAIANVVDIPNWMRTFAMNDLASYWDAFGNPNSKNSYLYRPDQSGWKIMCWDFDVGLGTGNGGGQVQERPTAPLFDTSDPGLARMMATPFIAREYWAALDEAVNSFFQPSGVQTFLADRYAAFQAAGIDTVSPFVPSGTVPTGEPQRSIPDWITARRNYILTQLAGVSNVFNVSGTNFITTGTNLVVLNGTAPVRVETITVNGVAYTPVWTTVTAWRLLLPLGTGTNTFDIAAWDRSGNVLSNITRTVVYTGAEEQPENNIVINEIMYNPLVPNATFIELFNRSTNYSFNLSGWRLSGVDFTFPPNTVITNRGFLVVCKDHTAFGVSGGWGVPIAGYYDGQLDNGGETITLIRPGATPESDTVVDRVTYDDDLPWPVDADGNGTSLQLLDPNQDNNRASNWGGQLGWRRYIYTGPAGSSPVNFLFFLQTAGDVHLDDVFLVLGSVPEGGPNIFQNGGFESGLSPWTPGGNHTNTIVDSTVAYSGNNSLFIKATGAGSGSSFVSQALTGILSTDICTLSFWYLPSTNGTGLSFRINATFRNATPLDYRPIFSTPGAPNSTLTNLPPYPLLWISEVQPQNVSTLADNFGDNDPWVEIHNSGVAAVDLSGFYLANSYSNLVQWQFPGGTTIQPGQYMLLWADGEPGETSGTNLHTNFRLNPTNGSVALSRILDGSPQVVDHLNYRDVGTNRSFGSFPPGQSSFRQLLYFPTPRGTNNPVAPPVILFINEWMAANTTFLRDPADLDFDDWFEIYNPTTNRVDLTGFSLTDDFTDIDKSPIPTGVSVPPLGYLLVWADEEQGQTQINGDLHVAFRLGQDGERIGLYDPAGRQIDAVVFGRQTNNISHGRWPNGGPAPYSFMTTPTPRGPNVIALVNPTIVSFTVNGNAVTIVWASQAGRSYRVQFRDDLSTGDWTTLGSDVGATGTTAFKVDQNSGDQRFYRVMLVQ